MSIRPRVTLAQHYCRFVFVRVLGPLVVETGQPPTPTPVPGAKERAVLGRLLVSAGHAVSVDLLVEDLWEGRPPPSARRSLQAHIVRLRTSLEPSRPKGSPGQFVVRRGDGYALAVTPADVDAASATVAASVGRAERARGDLLGARDRFATALAYWRGEPFEDWRDAGWAQAERRRLADVRASILEARIDVDLDLGRHRELVAELEALVAAEPLREGWWVRLMLALYRGDRQGDALAAGRRARARLAEDLGVEPGPALASIEEAVLAHADRLLLEPPGPVAATVPGRVGGTFASCPYLGLAPYGTEHAGLFHGRGKAIRTLVARVGEARLVVLSGPSGAGKSSLVRAGLAPVLARGGVPGCPAAKVVVVTPGAAPVDVLGPLLAVDDADGSASEPVVLVVDQFEELWTAGAGAGERAAFADALLAMLADGVIARAVLVLRGDYLGRLAEHAELAARGAEGLVLVPALTEPELRGVVEGPAAAVGVAVDPDLTDAVVRDVHGQAAAALPLLSTALAGAWEHRDGDELTLGAYVRAGGVTGALAATAEAALGSLGPDGPDRARRLLVRLAAPSEPGGGPSVTRRRVPLAELGLDGAGGAGRRAVVEALVGRRLLTVDAGHLEVTHEALLTEWPRLAGWLAEDALGRAVRTHLGPEAAGWQAAGRPTDRLYRGARLDAALEWLTRRDADPTAVERDFLQASADLAEAELAGARAQVRRERAARRRTRRLATGLAVLVVVAVTGGLLAAAGKRAADASALRADADRLAAAAADAGSPDLSLLLAAQAYRTERTPQTEQALLASVIAHRRIIGVYRAAGVARRLAVSADGRTLYAHTDTQVVAWDVATHRSRVLVDQQAGPPGSPQDVAASPARAGPAAGLAAVVTSAPAGADGRSSVLSLFQPDGRVRWSRAAVDLGGWPTLARFTGDGRRLAVVAVAGFGGPRPERMVVFVDTLTGRVTPTPIRELIPAGSDTTTLEQDLSQDATGVGMYSEGLQGAVTRDLQRGTTTTLTLQLPSDAYNLLPAGRGWLVTAADGTEYWYPPGASRAAQRIADHTSWVTTAATNAAGTVLVTPAPDLRLAVSDLIGGKWQRREVLISGGSNVLAVALDRSGGRAFSASDDGTVTAWDLSGDGGFGARIRTPYVAGLDPLGLIVLGDPAPAGPSGDWLVPVQRWGGPDTQGPIYGMFVDHRTLRAVGSVRASDRPPLGWPNETATTSRDGQLAAVTAMYSTAIVDLDTRRVIHRVTLPDVPSSKAVNGSVAHDAPEPAGATAWSADGRRLFLATLGARGVGPRGSVAVVDTRTWNVHGRIMPPGDAQAVAVSPDGGVLAVGLTDGDVVLADTGDYQVRDRLHVDGGVTVIAFSDDGDRVAAIGNSRRLDVWDVHTGRPVLDKPPSFAGVGTSLRWLPHSHTVIYGGDDGQAVPVDTDNGGQVGIGLPVYEDAGAGDVHIAPVVDDRLALFPGYRYIGQTREGVMYPLNPTAWLTYACTVVRRDLTPDEWTTYIPNRPHHPTCSDLR